MIDMPAEPMRRLMGGVRVTPKTWLPNMRNGTTSESEKRVKKIIQDENKTKTAGK